MDSEHRHELAENSLVNILQNPGEWWGQWGHIILIVVLLIIGPISIMRLLNYQKQTSNETKWAALALATSPETVLATADTQENPVRALLYLRGADMLLEKANKPQNDLLKAAEAKAATAANKQTSKTPNAAASSLQIPKPKASDPQKDLETAKQMYEKVTNDQTVNVLIRANAWLGLATIAESQKRWGDAKQAYQQAETLATNNYKALANQARTCASFIKDLQKPVIYSPEPKPIVTTKTPLTSKLIAPKLPAIELPQPGKTTKKKNITQPKFAPTLQ